MKTETFIVLTSDELDTIVKEKLSKYVIDEKAIFNYESVANHEWHNYSCYDYTRINRLEASNDDIYLKFDKQDVINGKLTNLHAMLLFLVEANEIPEGNYLIEVNW